MKFSIEPAMSIAKCRFAYLLIPFLLLSSCHYEVPVLPGSGGKTCEIIVITPTAQWNGEVGDSIRSYFAAIQPGLNQPEPYFDLVNIQPAQFNESEMFRRHRNVLIVEFDAQKEPSCEIFFDQWAFPQIVTKFTVPDTRAFDSLFTDKKAEIRYGIYAKEYQRIQKVFKASEEISVTDRLRKQYGFELVFPDGFAFSGSDKNFGWIRKESKDYGQGIIFFIYPYTGHEDFLIENIINRRNEMCRRVPGPADSSYMSTETSFAELYPFSTPINLNGLYAVETRGFWRLEGDFMGGPFVNYVIVDTMKNRIVMLDAYLYSPRKPKRDLLLQMEGIARGFRLYDPKASVAADSMKTR